LDLGHTTRPSLLRVIAYVESRGEAGAIGGNSDGSLDMCAMQINSQWLPTLARFGITGGDLLADECTCIYSGAWILAGEVDRHGRMHTLKGSSVRSDGNASTM
jgi:hypothetical protein